MKKYQIIIFLIFFLANAQLSAQKKWNLQQCVDTAITNNLNVRQSSNTVEINQLNYRQSKNNLLPAASASASESYNAYNSVNVNNSWNTNLSVSGNVNLFNGFQNVNAIKQNQAVLNSSKFDLEDFKNSLTIDIVNAYLQILYANEAIKVAENTVSASNEQVKITEVFVQTGKQAESNLLQVKSQLATDKLTLVNAKNTLRTAKLNLQQLMEIPSSDNFDVEYYQDLKIPAMVNDNVSSIYQTSLNVMPIVQSYKQKVVADQFYLNSLQNFWMPTLTLNGGISTSNSSLAGLGAYTTNTSSQFSDQLKNNLTGQLSLNLSIPIFNRLQNATNVKVQQIKLTNTVISQRSENNTLRKQIEQAFTDLINSMANYDALNEQFTSTTMSYNNSKDRYENGLMSATDLLVEKNKLIKAESDLLQAKYNLIFKSKILDYYKGNKITIQ